MGAFRSIPKCLLRIDLFRRYRLAFEGEKLRDMRNRLFRTVGVSVTANFRWFASFGLLVMFKWASVSCYIISHCNLPSGVDIASLVDTVVGTAFPSPTHVRCV